MVRAFRPGRAAERAAELAADVEILRQLPEASIDELEAQRQVLALLLEGLRDRTGQLVDPLGQALLGLGDAFIDMAAQIVEAALE